MKSRDGSSPGEAAGTPQNSGVCLSGLAVSTYTGSSTFAESKQ